MFPWVSVNDLIPNAFESVLIHIPSEAPLPTVHEGYYANGHWFWHAGQLSTGEVTHWSHMPVGPDIKEE